jgi:hypothetical protein
MGSTVSSALKSAIRALPEASPVNVLIAYDEASAGRLGMELFCALRSDVPGGVDLHCDLWRFDLIGLPGIHQAAVLAGTHARIIIVATHADIDLPMSVKDWLDQSFATKSPGSAAVVALLHSHRDVAGFARSPSRASLELMAYRRKLQFFGSPTEETTQEVVAGAAGPRDRAIGTSTVLRDIPNRQPRPPRWGINE